MKQTFKMLIALAMGLVLAARVAVSEQHPNIFLNQTEIDAIQAKVNAGAVPWKSAYDQMVSGANSALSAGGKSVVDNGAGVGGNGNTHLFSTDAPYTSCTTLNRGDLNAAEYMSKHIQNLGLAYAFTKQAKYADKCISLLKHWMTNPATYMYPMNKNWSPHTSGCGKQWTIELYISIPGMVFGADCIWDYAGWNASDKAGILDWINRYGFSARGGSYYNNGYNWNYFTLAVCGAFLNNQELLDLAVQKYRNGFAGELDANHLDGQMNLNGSLKYEIGRHISLDYTMFALLPMAGTAEVLRHWGVDLYSYTLPDGRCLQKGMDYAAPYVANPAGWPHPQESAYKGAQAGAFEFTNFYQAKSSYVAAVTKWGRPNTEYRGAMGHPTLTHAAGAFPFKIWVNTNTAIAKTAEPDNTGRFRVRVNPNPMQEAAAIAMDRPGRVRLYDGQGNLVCQLSGKLVIWDGRDLTGRQTGPGVYFYRVESNGNAVSGRIIKMY